MPDQTFQPGEAVLGVATTSAERIVLAAQIARAARLMEVEYAPPGALFDVEIASYYTALDRLADGPAT